ncbi:phage tail assembly protein [Pseudomonas sp. YY-1]|uniref:phage tail assembly protein n=1 Tax=Pseudomonas sp. YY-1 TaxID=2058659 RepID=UPI000CBD686F|nr:phage tail assembly protein [Pseudomonas sp. YY-1]PKQ40642.1 phage tail assembly protein [Pseudomonas sp. YY-1]
MITKQSIVTLSTPIIRGEQSISQIEVRHPKSGELRGIALTDLLRMEVDALRKLLPRITIPTLVEQEVSSLAPCDLVKLGVEVAGFLVPTEVEPDSLDV